MSAEALLAIQYYLTIKMRKLDINDTSVKNAEKLF